MSAVRTQQTWSGAYPGSFWVVTFEACNIFEQVFLIGCFTDVHCFKDLSMIHEESVCSCVRRGIGWHDYTDAFKFLRPLPTMSAAKKAGALSPRPMCSMN